MAIDEIKGWDTFFGFVGVSNVSEEHVASVVRIGDPSNAGT
jgi:hypothetical protein